jgi:hypothetical protein
MKATLHRSNRTGGTTVGSTMTGYPGLLNTGTLSHTLAAYDDSHAVVPHLPRKRQEGLCESCACREVLGIRSINRSCFLNQGGHTLCASSTNNTLPALPRSALVKIRVTISNNPQADFGSIKGSERSTMVNCPGLNRGCS